MEKYEDRRKIFQSREVENIYFEMTFMNRFSEEKMPAAWSNKDAPFSSWFPIPPNIIWR